MEKIKVSILLTIVLLCSCKDKEVVEHKYKLTSINAKALIYNEIIKPVDAVAIGYDHLAYNPGFSNKIGVQYNNDKQIVSTTGGPVLIRTGTNSQVLAFTNDIKDTITYKQDTVIMENPSFSAAKPNRSLFVIKNDRLVFRKEEVNYPLHAVYNYRYTYSGNTITETMKNLKTAVYYLTENNLTKVERYAYNDKLELKSMTEITFSGYDTSVNLLQGLYYINGAFYNAFSKNCYKEYTCKNYFITDGVPTLYSFTSMGIIDYQTTPDNIPDLFEYTLF